jgi:hypothetical protein
MEHDNLYISTYLVGSVKEDFTGRKEFDIYHHDYNKGSLWQIFQDIVSRVNSNNEDDLVVICYEGHHFADTYNRSSFLSAIFKCAELGTHLLIGGCDNFNNMVPISPNLYWIDMFSNPNTPFYKEAPIDLFLSHYYNGGDMERILSDWYADPEKNKDKFGQVYPVSHKDIAWNKDNADRMFKFCEDVKIMGTPTIFINGHELPNYYGIHELQYCI